MTSREFRQLRQLELIAFLKKNLGDGWRFNLHKHVPGKCADRRWFRHDTHGLIQDKIEKWCYEHGFVSRYDELLEPVSHHLIMLKDVLAKAECGGTVEGAALPVRKPECEQLLHALDFD